ncbi:MAG: Uma2 family endonuclease [Gemmataceae bacterium]
MSILSPPRRTTLGFASFRRFSVDEYHRMIESGILTDKDKVELLDGYVVLKMPRNPPHDTAVLKTNKRLIRLVPAGWEVRCQSAITLSDSEPEPDFVVVRGDETTYATRHPGAAEVGLLLEISDSSLDRDRHDKGPVYAAAGIAIYCIVNLIDRQVEAYSGPSAAGYANRQDYKYGDAVPLMLDGVNCGSIPVAELLP